MACVHGFLSERMNSSGSVGISKLEAKFEGLEGGEDGRGRSTFQTPNSRIKSTKSHKINKLQENILGLFLVGISGLGQKTTKSS